MGPYRTLGEALTAKLEEMIHEAQRQRLPHEPPKLRPAPSLSLVDLITSSVSQITPADLGLEYATQICCWRDDYVPGIVLQLSAPGALTRVVATRRVSMPELVVTAGFPAAPIKRALLSADQELGELLTAPEGQ